MYNDNLEQSLCVSVSSYEPGGTLIDLDYNI
ncbi:hypothetical protein H704_00468 [Bartonella bacilliformis Peru38]|nr:hypothetical protein X472_00502 [Bartonella bacilliformis San Pedro600-02]EYS95049.1 hypothetical protein X470_00561 [Bartonella bacilliformis Peru-18]KEG17722.1 hypothetical protein H709_00454 [Bartonella bacilliformis CUSCO5]KEG20930.1 hypothetical protein H704_00468 [Bartonella bacilliformis Peru38]KEG22625.1 hypothetical protein H703_00456 [Bartonella bacilliformis Ver075]